MTRINLAKYDFSQPGASVRLPFNLCYSIMKTVQADAHIFASKLKLKLKVAL